jgi:hypothetical protein
MLCERRAARSQVEETDKYMSTPVCQAWYRSWGVVKAGRKEVN